MGRTRAFTMSGALVSVLVPRVLVLIASTCRAMVPDWFAIGRQATPAQSVALRVRDTPEFLSKPRSRQRPFLASHFTKLPRLLPK